MVTKSLCDAPPSARHLHDRYDRPLVFTMTELNQHTAGVLAEINAAGRPAAITKHGKFVVMIHPLEGSSVESMVLSRGSLAEEFVQHAEDADQADWEDDLLSNEEVEQRSHR